jgi:hypothetical protein
MLLGCKTLADEEKSMKSGGSIPTYDELASYISDAFASLLSPYMEWANLARRAVQGLPYDSRRLTLLENYINERRADLRPVVLIASEHLDELQLSSLRSQARMSKTAWRSLKRREQVNLKHGFRLISY